MVRKSLGLLMVLIFISTFIVGCEKSEPEVQEVTPEQAQQIAEKEINHANLDSEIEKMQKEIQADN